jgi:hypothetical protein
LLYIFGCCGFFVASHCNVDMIWTRCLLLMTALAVNTLVAGQPFSVQEDKPINEGQQEITIGIVPEVPIQAVDSQDEDGHGC